MFNSCTFIGRLTKKPEFRVTSTGKSLLTFTLAVDRDFPDQNGKWVADFIDFVAWNKRAENINNKKYDKGNLLVVSGQLQNHSRTDKDGNSYIAAEINVQKCRLVNPPKRTTAPESGHSQNPAEDFEMLEDDDAQLPF